MRRYNKNFTAEEQRNKKLFLGNTTVQVIGVFVKVATGMAITGVLARYLGVEGFGRLSLALVYFSFTGILVSLGSAAILVREVVKVDASDQGAINELATAGLVLHAVSASVAILLLALYLIPKDYSAVFKTQILLLSLSHILTMLGSFDFIFRANLKMAYSVYAGIAYRILHLLLITGCAYAGMSLTVIVATYVAANFANSLMVYAFSRKFFRFRFRWNGRKTLFILRETFPVGIASGLWIIYYRVDILMLDWLKDVSSVAIYNAAFRFADYAYMFSAIIMSSIYPLMAARYPDNPEGLKRIYQKTVDYIAIIGGVGSVLLLILAGGLISLLFGNDYGAAVTTLRIMSFIPLVVCLNNAYGHMLLVLGMQGKALVLMRCAGVVINVGLNLLLIPRYGYYGAAWATVATELLLLLMIPLIINTRLKFIPSARNFFLIIIVLAGSFALFMRVESLWVRSVVPAAAFVALIGLLGRCNWDELWAMVFLKPGE